MEIEKVEFETECLSKLKKLIQTEASENELFKKVINDEEFLKLNLKGRKFDVNFAFETIKGYIEARYVKYSFVYEIPPCTVRHIIESGVGGVLKNKDKDGNWILVGRLTHLNLSTMTWEHLTRAAILAIEYFQRDSDNARRGQVLIGDAAGFSFSVFRHFSISQYLSSLEIFYRNYPNCVKSVHIVNTSRIANYTYSMMKPFVPAKLASRVSMQGKEMKPLHEQVSRDILPKWLGGCLTDEEAFDYDVVEDILEMAESYE